MTRGRQFIGRPAANRDDPPAPDYLWVGLPGRWGGDTLRQVGKRSGGDGTLTSGPTWTAGPNGFGAVSFDGSNDYVTCPSVPAIGTNDFTLSVAFRPNSASGPQMVIGRDDGSTPQFRLWVGVDTGFNVASGAIDFHSRAAGGGAVGTAPAGAAVITAGAWTHVAVTRVGSVLTMYLNGVSYSTATDTANYSGAIPLTFGRQDEPGFPYYFAGTIGYVSLSVGSGANGGGWDDQFRRGLPDLRRAMKRSWSVGVSAASGVTGTASVTEGADTLSGAGAVALAGAASPTESADTLSAASALAIAGAATPTEGADTLSAASVLAISGAASPTEGADTLSAASALALSGTASPTEGADTLSAAGAVSLTGAAGVTEGADTLSGASALALTGTAAPTESPDTLAATGSAPGTGTATITEAADTLISAAVLALAASLSKTEGPDTLAGVAALALAGTLAKAEAPDTLSAAGSGPGGTTDTGTDLFMIF